MDLRGGTCCDRIGGGDEFMEAWWDHISLIGSANTSATLGDMHAMLQHPKKSKNDDGRDMAEALYASAPHLFLFAPKLKTRPANGQNNNCAVNTVEHASSSPSSVILLNSQ